MLRIFAILFFVFVEQLLCAQSAFVVTNQNKKDTLTEHLLYTTGNFELNELSKQTFKPVTKGFKFDTNNTYWFKITLINNTPLDLFHVVQYKSQSAWRLNYIEAHIVSTVKQDTCYVNCSNILPASELTYYNQRGKFNLLLRKADTLTVYTKVWNTTGHPVKFDMLIYPSLYVDKVETYVHSFHMFYEGLMWFVFLYNLLIIFIYRDRTYLYYSLYIFLTAIYTLFFYRYLLVTVLREVPTLDPYFWIISINIGPVFYWLFLKNFIDFRKLVPPIWLKIVTAAIWVKILYTGGLLLILTTSYNMWLINLIISIEIIIETVLNIIIIARLLLSGDTKVKYFAAASFTLWVGFFTGNILYIQGVENAQIYGEIGVIGEMLLFSLGLGYRMRENEQIKQKAQADLIKQLEENHELQNKANRELEGKVQERTSEILMQKHELEAQSEEINEKNRALAHINNQMTDSIKYASHIQRAILGSKQQLTNNYFDAFVLLMPHSIVSGDFYWYSEIEKENKIYKIIAAADCTGHGVPGAFMTVLGHDFLDDIVNRDKHILPDQILHELDEKLRIRLDSGKEATQINDGMDISILVFNETDRIAAFAGARSSVCYVQNNELHEIKGSKFSIGGKQLGNRQVKQFDVHQIKYQAKDKFYLFTDGYYDQIGGITNRKYLSKNFRTLLSSIAQLPMEKQRFALEQEHQRWRAGIKQTDDIMIIGVQVK